MPLLSWAMATVDNVKDVTNARLAITLLNFMFFSTLLLLFYKPI